MVEKRFPEAEIFKEPFDEKTTSKCADAQVLCGMIDSKFSAKNLSKCPNLGLIVTRTVGYDNIDLEWAKKNGVAVCNVPDYGSHVIAEHVFALLLSSIRMVLEGEKRTGEQHFSWKGLRGMALKGKIMGVVGTGKIGLNVCRIASLGFQMNVIAYDKFKDKKIAEQNHFKYVNSLDEIWKKSDVISLHLPLFPGTKHMINAGTIAKMKDGVVLINTARGGLINTKALIRAIKKGKFGHVALDVIEHETDVKEDKEILSLPGVIITPHIAFYADDSIKAMFEDAMMSIEDFMKGKELKHKV